jgi:EmrB/QacA subfamily drug resistance transporter
MNDVSVAGAANRQLSRTQFFGTIIALQIILLLAALDQTVISTAMPHIVMQLGGFDRYAWATTGYLLASTIAVPVLGKISDLYGRKIVLTIGVAIFILASVLCGIAGESWMDWVTHISFINGDGMNQLIIARTLQGIGGGAIVGLSFSVIGDLLPPATRGKYQGLFAAVFALASIVGPTVGGYIADISSWRYLFLVNIPIGILGIILFAICFPGNKIEIADKKVDVIGIVLFSIGVVALLLGLNFSNNITTNWQSFAWLCASLVSFGLFAWAERTAVDPFVPLFVFKNPIILISAFSVAVTGVGMFGSTLLIPLFMQSVLGLTAAKSGLFLSPLIITVAVFSVVGGYWMSKSGKYRAVVLSGLAAMTVGVFLLSGMNLDSPLPIILGFMILVGIGLGLLLPIYTVVIQNAVSDDFLGTVTGLSQFSRSIGGTLGVAGFGALLLFFYQGHMTDQIESIQTLPPAVMHYLNNPLAGNHLQADIESALSSTNNSATAHKQAMELTAKSRFSLVYAIDNVFRLYGMMLLIAFCLNLFLRQIPLRSQVKPSEVIK